MKRMGIGMATILAACLTLGGCAWNGGATDTGNDPPTPSVTDTEKASLQVLVDALQKELATLKEQKSAEQASYEKRIAELEALLVEMGASGEGDTTPTPQPPSEDASFSYEVRNGGAWITGGRVDGNRLSIPSSIDGVPVVGINEGAFRNYSVEEVILPEGLQTVGWFAFSGCYRLRSVTLPESVRDIGYGAFELCSTSLRFICPTGSYAAQYAKSYGIPVST